MSSPSILVLFTVLVSAGFASLGVLPPLASAGGLIVCLVAGIAGMRFLPAAATSIATHGVSAIILLLTWAVGCEHCRIGGATWLGGATHLAIALMMAGAAALERAWLISLCRACSGVMVGISLALVYVLIFEGQWCNPCLAVHALMVLQGIVIMRSPWDPGWTVAAAASVLAGVLGAVNADALQSVIHAGKLRETIASLRGGTGLLAPPDVHSGCIIGAASPRTRVDVILKLGCATCENQLKFLQRLAAGFPNSQEAVQVRVLFADGGPHVRLLDHVWIQTHEPSKYLALAQGVDRLLVQPNQDALNTARQIETLYKNIVGLEPQDPVSAALMVDLQELADFRSAQRTAIARHRVPAAPTWVAVRIRATTPGAEDEIARGSDLSTCRMVPIPQVAP